MATSHDVYRQGLLGLADGDIDWDGATNIAAILLTAAHTPDLTTHSTFGDVSAHHVDDADYDPQAVTTRAVALDNGVVQYTADDVVFGTEVTISAQYMAFVVGDPANLQAGDRLISLHDFGEERSSTNATFRVNAPANGWFTLTEAS